MKMARLYWAKEVASRLATEPLLAECQGKTHIPLPVSDRQGRWYCFNCVVETFQTQAYNLARRVAVDTQCESQKSALRPFSGPRWTHHDNPLHAVTCSAVAHAS